MATVFRNIDSTIAHTKEAQAGLRKETLDLADRARGIMSDHRYAGHAKITTGGPGQAERAEEYPDIDHLVILDDEDGLKAAMTMEFGRKNGPDGKGGMRPIAPLRTAAGLLDN